MRANRSIVWQWIAGFFCQIKRELAKWYSVMFWIRCAMHCFIRMSLVQTTQWSKKGVAVVVVVEVKDQKEEEQ